MKKEYIQPKAKTCTMPTAAILAGSINVSDGTTPEQNAKEFSYDF